MDKRVKIALISVLAIFVAAIAFGIIYAVLEQTAEIKTKYDDPAKVIEGEGLKQDGDFELSKYYLSQSATTYSYTIFLIYDNGEYHFSVGTSDTASGTYTQDGNIVNVNYTVSGSSDGTSEDTQMIVTGDYIFFNTAICCGDEIPDTTTFNAKVSRLSSDGTAYQYTFHEDGTYELLYGKRGRTNWNTVSGHYTRNADGSISRTLITVKTGEENDSLPFLVYEGHLIDSVYDALTEDEYNAKLEELAAANAESEE